MHLANTPVVSPESKKPKALTSGFEFFRFETTERIPSVREKSSQFFPNIATVLFYKITFTGKYFSFCDF
ncbi:Uncharacterised protein [Raoultella ornithinolytica]|nr:Uncharacterised protein [Raoultella ornithinolytica]